MLDKGVIEQTVPSDKHVVGHLLLVPQYGWGLRPVCNMKPLNHYIQYHHFKMGNLSMVKTTILKNDYMVK